MDESETKMPAKYRHTVTGAGYWPADSDEICWDVFDAHGELHTFKASMLVPPRLNNPVDEWKTVPPGKARVNDDSQLVVHRLCGATVMYPHPSLRFHDVDGLSVLQERV